MKQSYPEIVVNGETRLAESLVTPTKLPARTVVDFSKAKITSRLVIGLMALAFCAHCAPQLVAEEKLGFFTITLSAILALVGLWFTTVSVYHLLVRKPVLTIDAEGLAFLKHEPIAWADVRSVQVRVLESSSGRDLRFLRVTPAQDRAPFEVDLTQTTTDPEKLVRTLESYIAVYRDANGLPTDSR